MSSSTGAGIPAIVHLRIPIFDEQHRWPAMVFSKWLPGLAGPAWKFSEGRLTATLSFDETCSENKTAEQVARHLNTSASHINVDVQIDHVPIELADFIWAQAKKDLIQEEQLQKNNPVYAKSAADYGRLAEEALRFGIKAYNRLVDYARTEKQQYWLNRCKFDSRNPGQTAIRFFARISFLNSTTFIGQVLLNAFPNIISLDVVFSPEGPAYAIRSEEGSHVQDFLNSASRVRSVLEFLANAKELLGADHPRSAIIEAMAAIETAMTQFFQVSKLERREDVDIPNEFNVETIVKSLSRIGVGNSIKFLLPLTLPTSKLPQTVIDQCYELYELRNKTIHDEKRNFQGIELRSLIDEAEKLCRILIEPGSRPATSREWREDRQANA